MVGVKLKRVWAVGVIGCMLIALAPQIASAAVSSCIANVNPKNVTPAEGVTYTITIANYGTTTIRWVDMTVASDGFIFTGNSISGWITADHEGGVSAFNGSIAPGASQDFQVSAIADVSEGGSVSWTVQASDDSDGTPATTCTGSTSTTVGGVLPQEENISVSNVQVRSITSSTAQVTWNTDFPTTSLVYYGPTSSYGKQSAYSTALTQSHSVGLNGLSPSSIYHFQVAGSNGGGQFAYSSDGTFMTAAAPVTQTPTVTPSITAPKPSTGTSRPTTQPPAITLNTVLSGVYKAPPAMSGKATDDTNVAAVEYSTDNGRNWLPVDSKSGSGRSVSFTFTPIAPQDGNYLVVARVIDAEGQTSISKIQTLIIDQLPPSIGGTVMSIGPQILQPNATGIIHAARNLDQKITMSSVGGATSVVVKAQNTDKKKVAQQFTLTKSEDTGLWSGALSYNAVGTYVLSVSALDGANNTTTRDIGTVVVHEPGKVLRAKTQAPQKASIEVWYRDPDTRGWLQWDAPSYDQTNPVTQAVDGTFALYLPAGTYHLKVRATDRRTLTSQSFTITEATAISPTIKLRDTPGITLGPIKIRLPTFALSQTNLELTSKSADAAKSPQATALPLFNKKLSNGSAVNTTQLFGKPTIMTFFTTWAPAGRDELAIINELQTNNRNVIAVSPSESPARLEAYLKIANYSVPVIVDEDNSLMTALKVSNVPTTIIFDRSGKVTHILPGVTSKSQLETYVSE